MKTLYKTSAFAFLLFNLAASFSASAQLSARAARPALKPQAVRNYAVSLRSTNHGVVESAIFNTLVIAALRPDADIRTLHKEINRLETIGHSPSIRYKSLLARYVFKHPELLAEVPPSQYPSDIEYFQALTAHLGTKLLSDPAVAVK